MEPKLVTIPEKNGHVYRIGRLDTFKQLHLARRLAPILAGLTQGFERSVDFDFKPIAEALSKMDDESVNYIITSCLSVVQRRSEVNGQELWAAMQTRGQLMFQDLDLPDLLKITVAVIEENLSGFFTTARPSLPIPIQ